VLIGVTVYVEELEEAQMNLQTMLTMRHVKPFREETQDALSSLSDTSDTLELWLKVQLLWCSLESVFLGGDIAKQMPGVAKKFAKVDKDWVKIMAKAVEQELIVKTCENELLRSTLPVMYSELEKCQKSLEGYLEKKRNIFPRFYFVSNPVLLQILSQGSDPQAVQAYYEKIFDSIDRVEHDTKDKSQIKVIVSRQGTAEEKIQLLKPVKAQGNIEDWLSSLLDAERRTMKDLCSEMAGEASALSISGLRGFVDAQCGQYALLGIQFLWTEDCQAALEQCKTKRTAMRDANNKALTVLDEISGWCLQPLGTKMNRKKIETLVTIQVHQRDVINELAGLFKNKKLNSADDFEWLKQARFFWKPDGDDQLDDNGCCSINVTDVEFKYQYEYLGCKERLVITPLTDRCYITLAQALGMYFGGAPAGPAGTGKTETVKDMGRTLGIYVVVTNCTDQMRYTDCAKIFKGLCQAGLWGCFDEFNRITLPVLSVVAQQVLAVQNAKKNATEKFQFPGDPPQDVTLDPICGFFITMNPGYAGRQELPENLKALFRGVAMMVPDREIIIKVKLCSVGYKKFTLLSKKFFMLYSLSEEQLSKQKHYDFGLRNILSVLRTAGQTLRDNLESDEEELLYRTLRDMNLSKLVAQDVPLFISLLSDLFPKIESPAKSEHPAVEEQIKIAVENAGLVHHASWVLKVVQLYETSLVRHGIMLSGPTGGGKTRIIEILQTALSAVQNIVYKQARLNPKAIRAEEMYGETDPLSGEWTKGVFAAMWEKFNNRENAYNTWIVCDGPVDAIWIEDLNTVLDDNRILTLASGDRIPMTDNVKIMFENENLNNASPATVSRAGIIYVSDTDLDWAPVFEAWVRTRPEEHQGIIRDLCAKHVGENTATEIGQLFDFKSRKCDEPLPTSRIGMMAGFGNLFQQLCKKARFSSDAEECKLQMERLFLYCLTWTIGGLLEPQDRVLFDEKLRKQAGPAQCPEVGEGETMYEYFVDTSTLEWERWRPEAWEYPDTEVLDFSNLLVPTMDSTRAIFLLEALHVQKLPVLMIGGAGTAKTSVALMFFRTFDPEKRLLKRVNFSSATTPGMFQSTIESELDKRGGKSFGPPNGKKMTVFLDDVSMPLVNTWGDQPTLEIVRQLVETHGFCFLDKDKRGDVKHCEDLQYIAAMNHPGSGKNDIPNRAKRHFFVFNLILPDINSIDDIYGQMLRGRFSKGEFDNKTLRIVDTLTEATIEMWRLAKNNLLPTPAKFHYVFNMRELSRVFQGILLTPKDTIKTGGIKTPTSDTPTMLLRLWKHECMRVFQDKLTNEKDKKWFEDTLEKVTAQQFGDEAAAKAVEEAFFVDFLRDDVYDEDEVLVEKAPKIYEPGGTLKDVRDVVTTFMTQHNVDNPSRSLELVLFEDALRHLIRISRLIGMPRGSALLVGVGGSGKQSLTRLAAYIARSVLFQISLTKTYNTASLMEDLRELYRQAGQLRQSVTFLFTDAEIKDEAFLEYINSVLMTGEVAGLFAKDEMLAMCADLRPFFIEERPELAETPDNLKAFFTDCVRDNLHLVLCMSPVNVKFPDRARMFPGLISGTTIDWFLPWPEEALMAVSRGFLGNFEMEADDDVKAQLITHMGMVHKMVVEACTDYFAKMRRNVYQTPKSYLSFIQNYRTTYTDKLAEVNIKEERINLGLQKLVQGAKDVEAMKVVLAEEQIKLDKATKDTNEMLESLEISSSEAERESEKVNKIKMECELEAARIAGEKSACEADLAKAQPFLDQANTAIASIKPAHINEVKKLPKPSDIIRLVFDGVLILFMEPMDPVGLAELTVKKKQVELMNPSYGNAQKVMADSRFLTNLQTYNKDAINEETIELMIPYIDFEDFTPEVAKAASAAAEGLCTWVRAMKDYHGASKIVKPKLEALAIAEGQMETALRELEAANNRLEACNERLAELKSKFDTQIAAKEKIKAGALALQRKMEQASALINGLAGERQRWSDDSKMFNDVKRRLVGDCAVACAFISYCGPFNQTFRQLLVVDNFQKDCRKRGVPVTSDLDVTSFTVDIGTIGDWNLQGLPTDPLSVQNGILVTRSSRYPLLVDPQGQALNWIKNKEADTMPMHGPTQLNDDRLKDQLEFAMQEGKALVILGVEEEVDPMLDPVLEKQVIRKAKRNYVKVGDKLVELSDEFMLYFITRLPNPHFSPELQAKTTVVDFTVTMKGLEEQLLGRVIGKEQQALEELLNQVLEEVNSNTKALLQLDAELLERLTSNTGNLLDDSELVGVLANTKAKAAEVKEKLIAADETRRSINEKREQFRPVATRGSVLYFAIVEMSLVNVMYQTSLAQFLQLFMKSMDVAEKASLASKRVVKIVDAMTYLVYRYINLGLYEKDKQLFVFITAVKILITAGMLEPTDVTLFLRGGAALNITEVRKKPSWISNEAWLNVIALSEQCSFYKSLPENITRNEAVWRRWYEDNEPDALPVPDYDMSITDNKEVGPWFRILLLRSCRPDRTLLVMKEFIRDTQELGPRYVEPITDSVESIYEDSVATIPIVFLLSTGADPTDSIETLAKKRKQSVQCVSLGQGQEVVAKAAMSSAATNGTWVLLQNCELGLGLMNEMEGLLADMMESVVPEFRLFITALPHPKFPLGLLQMSTKVTNEPPAGLQAGLLRSYTVMVDQDRLERIDTVQWRQLTYAMCFLHSVVQERRKFGPLGWNIPYEYNDGDLGACIMFLEKHLYSGSISWPTVQYMVSEAQYGGKITDDMDRRLFNAYASNWVCSAVEGPTFSYNPKAPINAIPKGFDYKVCDALEIETYRKYAASFPTIDSPEIYGLHPNADLTFRVKEVNEMLEALSDTQPKQSSAGSGPSREDIVMDKCAELLAKMPDDYVEEEFKATIVNKLDGLGKPLNIFLYQEIQRLQRVIHRVRTMLTVMQQAIRGEVVMTGELVDAMNEMFAAKVPKPWLFTPGGDEFSWLSPTLGLWFTSLLARDAQDREWLSSGRPRCYWMTGFFNPQGFLTAMKQEVTRLHKKDAWALDDVVYYSEVTEYDRAEQVRSAPKEGVYIHGLFLDGARWQKASASKDAHEKPEATLAESEPKKLFAQMPVLFVTAMTKALERGKSPSSSGVYSCPCYKYPARTDRYLIFMVKLRSKGQKPVHWVFRGVALLCTTD